MKNILIISSDYDKTVEYIYNKFKENISFYIFNINKFYDYEVEIDNSGWRITNKDGVSIKNTEVYSIYYRKPRTPILDEYNEIDKIIIQNDIITIIHGIVNDFEGRVITKPKILKVVENKVYQLLYARKNKIRIPNSLIGNSSHKLKENENGGQSIIKPITKGRIEYKDEVVLFQTELFNDWDANIIDTPIYIQEYIEKNFEVRVTVVENEIFAVRIDTKNKIDWRKDYENHKYTIIDIPIEIKEFILKCMNDFEISFGAFDFIVNQKDEWIFLEVNPNGQWLWLENELNLKISDKIISMLIR